MKLIPLIMIIISIRVKGAHEQFNFAYHLPNQNPGIFSSESSFYLPPESHTPLPVFSIKDFNNLPLPYLPPNNRAHSMFSTPFPFLVTTTTIPSDDNEEEDDVRNTYQREENKPLNKPALIRNYNRTEPMTWVPQIKREMKPLPKNFQISQQIDRKDLKPFPFAPNNLSNTMKNAVSQTATPRSLIISPENNKIDQIKSGSFLTPQYLTSPGLFVSSTIEPAIPIIRLSNEMDLDGSFSYEALGADQTHYVQHSRMENVGSDKQEQVVEGSYSYVGDNGQTYTVHYIADLNGFRASGEHLPVAPPIPEIIQRSIQYNLAEEARNPALYKNSWEHGNDDKEISENEKLHRFAFSPPLNLFTGKTPESFSHGFKQTPNREDNLLAAASKNIIKTVEFAPDKVKPKINTEAISPQITFVASQGAHVPSMNTPQQQSQQTTTRMFTNEKPTMPQLVNYEAAIKDADQENNKALWRWQYGLSTVNNQNSNMNSISRSSNDDVIINFNDMTPEQYSQMIKTEIQNENYSEQQDNKASTDKTKANNLLLYSTPSSTSIAQFKDTDKYISNSDSIIYNEKLNYAKKPNNQSRSDARAKLITLSEFIPSSQIVTQSYDYIESFGNRKTKSFEEEINNLNVIPLSRNEKPSKAWSDMEPLDTSRLPHSTHQKTLKSNTPSNSRFTDFIIHESDVVNPVVSTTTEELSEVTTEAKLEEALKDNLFLKSIFNNNSKVTNKSNDEANEYKLQHKAYVEIKPQKFTNDRSIKYFALQARPFAETNTLSKKPADMSDVMKFMSSNTNFESNKVKPRNRSEYDEGQTKPNNLYKNSYENPEFEQPDKAKSEKNYENLNHQQQEELKGLIKNYKILQRKNNGYSNEERIDYIRRISPPVLGNMHSSLLPPLGRVGPSTKSYLPPINI